MRRVLILSIIAAALVLPGGCRKWNNPFDPANNHPPNVPSEPAPDSGSVRQDTSLVLTWTGGDPDSADTVIYDVYLGTDSQPPLVKKRLDTVAYHVSGLDYSAMYYWKIVAHDSRGDSAVGPVWSFTTIATANHPPNMPSVVSPDSGATGQSRWTTLSWAGGDPDQGDTVSYDIYFGTSASPPLMEPNHRTNSFAPGTLGYDVEYYWKIVARDNHSATTQGPVWQFHTVTPIIVTAPDSSTRWGVGSSQTIEWNGGTKFSRSGISHGRVMLRRSLRIGRSRGRVVRKAGVDSTVIYYSTNNGVSWIRYGRATNPGRYDWTVPGPETSEALVQVRAYVEAETVVGTSGQFEIYDLPSPITVTMPTDSTRWRQASAQTILWTGGTDGVDSTVIYYSTNNGGAWIRQGKATVPGRYNWTVPGPETREALVQVRAYVEAETVVGTSGQFEIYSLPSPITVTMPTDSTRWRQASAQTILWTGGTDGVDSTLIYFSTNNGVSWIRHGRATNQGRYDWNVPGPATPNAKVQIRAWLEDKTVVGTSARFEIYDFLKPSPITVTSPAGGEQWGIGTIHHITWNGGTDGVDSSVVYYSSQSGASWKRQGKSLVPGLFVWKVPGPVTVHALIQVRAYCLRDSSVGKSDTFEVTGARYPDSVVATVTVGEKPRGLCWNRTDDKVYVANYKGGSVTIINSTTNQVDTTVTVGSYPSSLVYDPVHGKVYVANEGSHSVSVIDGASNAVVATVEVGMVPKSLAWNRTGNKVYVANYGSGANSVSVIDATADTVVATVGVGARPIAVCWNPVANKVYAACWTSGEVTIIDGAGDTVITTVPVGSNPCFGLVDSIKNEIYVANQHSNTLSVIDGASNMTLAVINVSLAPCKLCWNPVSGKIYSVDKDDDNITVISTATHQWIANVGVGQDPAGIIWMPEVNMVYVANHGSNDVTIIGGESNHVELTLDAGAGPIALCFNTTDSKVYVANNDSGTVSVIGIRP